MNQYSILINIYNDVSQTIIKTFKYTDISIPYNQVSVEINIDNIDQNHGLINYFILYNGNFLTHVNLLVIKPFYSTIGTQGS